MDVKEAILRAQDILDNEFKNESFNVIIDEKYTVEFSRGWLFCYNIDSFVNDPFSEDFLITTKPIIVDKVDETITRMSNCNLRFAGAEEMIAFYLNSKDGAIDIESAGERNYPNE